MLCQQCQEEPATVHVTRIVNDHKTEMHLCEKCAKERGEAEISMEPSFAFHNILAGLFEPEAMIVPGPARRSIPRCSHCGLSLADFRKLGKLGCSECYSEFEKELEPLLKRIHRSVEHVGKSPQVIKDNRQHVRREIEKLRTRLNEAVTEEAYEEAARLRDEIRSLEAKLGSS